MTPKLNRHFFFWRNSEGYDKKIIEILSYEFWILDLGITDKSCKDSSGSHSSNKKLKIVSFFGFLAH